MENCADPSLAICFTYHRLFNNYRFQLDSDEFIKKLEAISSPWNIQRSNYLSPFKGRYGSKRNY
jgi:hypothetical protein